MIHQQNKANRITPVVVGPFSKRTSTLSRSLSLSPSLPPSLPPSLARSLARLNPSDAVLQCCTLVRHEDRFFTTCGYIVIPDLQTSWKRGETLPLYHLFLTRGEPVLNPELFGISLLSNEMKTIGLTYQRKPLLFERASSTFQLDSPLSLAGRCLMRFTLFDWQGLRDRPEPNPFESGAWHRERWLECESDTWRQWVHDGPMYQSMLRSMMVHVSLS